jgi:hypothetical protein
MVIQGTAVLHNGGNPNGSKTQVFDVIEFAHQSFEITAPGNILGIFDVVGGAFVPAAPFGGAVVGRITVKKAGGDEEIDTLFTDVALGQQPAGQGTDNDKQKYRKPFHGVKNKGKRVSVKVILRVCLLSKITDHIKTVYIINK